MIIYINITLDDTQSKIWVLKQSRFCKLLLITIISSDAIYCTLLVSDYESFHTAERQFSTQ